MVGSSKERLPVSVVRSELLDQLDLECVVFFNTQKWVSRTLLPDLAIPDPDSAAMRAYTVSTNRMVLLPDAIARTKPDYDHFAWLPIAQRSLRVQARRYPAMRGLDGVNLFTAEFQEEHEDMLETVRALRFSHDGYPIDETDRLNYAQRVALGGIGLLRL